MKTTKALLEDDLAVSGDFTCRPFVGHGDAPEPSLKVGCSTAAWSKSQPAIDGGDVADSFVLPDERFVAAVWDAAGHGVAAAPDALLVRAGLRALLSANPDIVLAVFALNRVLFRRARTLLPWPFVSGFFGVVDRKRHTLRYISCGHETAILFHGRSGHVHLAHNSPLLGINEAADLTVDMVRVERGDKLVIVSNGVTDARPLCSQTEFFGTARLCSYFQAEASGRAADAPRLIEHVVTFAGGALHDDAAVLIAHFD